MGLCAKKKNPNASTRKDKKPKRKNKSDLGEDFVAPDGGWGWLVCVAAGISNLVAFPVLQHFGLLLRERLIFLGLTNSQITTVINVHSALSACTGLLNGPMFRRFSYRQVALAGATLMSSGLFLISLANSFLTYIITFSVLYGIGIGISISSSCLALNTYFKEKRRKATGFSWTITALGPIVMPYVVTGFLDLYGVQGSVIMFSAIAMLSFVSALIYQPVLWHVKIQPAKDIAKVETTEVEDKCKFCKANERKNNSQYPSNADEVTPSYEITDPGTPMMSRANDGWFSKSLENFGSKRSLDSRKSEPICNIRLEQIDKGRKCIDNVHPEQIFLKPNSSNADKEVLKASLSNLQLKVNNPEIARCACHEDRELHNSKILEEEEQMLKEGREKCRLSTLRKVALFFDLDLLKDLKYVNLMVGLTLANFAEMNFAILTPFILSDFGCTKEEAAFAMSLLAGMDISMRFLIPFFTEKIGWENRTFYLIGVVGMAIGRIIIAHVHLYNIILIVFAWIGLNKGLRTIFMGLVIPSYVPLKRLPAASGLQLVFMGIFSFTFGPIVGLIRDATNYTFTLHCLNIATFTTAVSWMLEKFIIQVSESKSKK